MSPVARNGKPLASWVVKGLLPFVSWALGSLGVPTGLSAFRLLAVEPAGGVPSPGSGGLCTAFSREVLAGLHVDQSIPCVRSEGQEGPT